MTIYPSSDLSTSSNKAQGPIYDFGPYPYNSPSKLQFFPLIQGEKVGFWFLRDKTIYFSSSHMWNYRFACPMIATDAS